MLLSPITPIQTPETDTDAVVDAVQGITLGDWLVAAGIFVGSILVALVAGRVLRRVMSRRSPASAQLLERVLDLFVVGAGFVYALASIGVDVGLFVGALGIGGIALAFAFQDILENFVAGIILQLKRPFRTGSIVEAGEERHLGRVREIDSRSVILDMFSGERIVLPAAEVLKSPIINWTANTRRRIAVPIGIAYRTDPQDAIDAITPRLAEMEEALPEPPPRVLLTELGDSSVNLTAYVWHDSFGDVFWVRHRVVQEAKAALVDAGIEIPFPQRVISHAPEEEPGEGSPEDGQDEPGSG